MGIEYLIGNMVSHNNTLQSSHLRKHWMRRVKCFFNAPAHKKIRREKRSKKAAALGVRPINKLRPLVFGNTRKYGSKTKFGRGFSLAELAEAKLSQAFARSVGIAVDHRRHNRNAETMAQNVERLTNYKSKMILFPVRADHPKKGEIADSSAEQLKSASQNTTHSVVELKRSTPRCKPEKLTQEMKDARVYQKLRQERINKRYNGKREKAKKLMEEK